MKVVIGIVLLGLATSTNAQDYEKKDKMKDKVMPYITRSIGVSFQSFDGINNRVVNFPQFEQLKDGSGTLGLGWLKEQNRLISAGSIDVGSSMSGDKNKKSSTIRYAGISADIGYDVVKSENVILYPMVGIGFQGYQALFFRDNSSVPFDELLRNPSVENDISAVKFNNSFLGYRVGFGVAFKSPKHPGNAIGLKAGYTGSFKKNSWKSNENQLLAGAPQDKVSQFYVSLVLMNQAWFGGHHDKWKK